MSWKHDLLDKLADVLRFTVKVCLFLDVFLLSLFTVWFSLQFFWHLARWLDRVMFSSDW